MRRCPPAALAFRPAISVLYRVNLAPARTKLLADMHACLHDIHALPWRLLVQVYICRASGHLAGVTNQHHTRATDRLGIHSDLSTSGAHKIRGHLPQTTTLLVLLLWYR